MDLSFNNVKTINRNLFDGLVSLQNLHLLQLSNRTLEIEPFTFIDLNNLEMLNLSHNHIGKVCADTFQGLSKLSLLTLAPVQIDKIDSFGFADIGNSVRELNLSNTISSPKNRTIIDKKAFYNLTNLVALNLANNRIENLSVGLFSKLISLQRLNLSNIYIADIQYGTFSQMKNLVILDLSRNLLKKFDFSHFLPGSVNLQKIYLYENHLTEIDGFVQFRFQKLITLDISENSFNCTYLKKFLSLMTYGVNSHLIEVSNNISFNPHEVNIQGVQCTPTANVMQENVDEKNNSKAIETSSISVVTKSSVDNNNDNQFVLHAKATNPNLEQMSDNLTIVLSTIIQEQTDLHTIKISLVFICIILTTMFIVILILISVNYGKIVNTPWYRGVFEQSERQSTVCINDDIEVSTFNK